MKCWKGPSKPWLGRELPFPPNEAKDFRSAFTSDLVSRTTIRPATNIDLTSMMWRAKVAR